MSKAKFAAVKELISEQNYDVARSVLRTMNSPTAQQWLTKLDEISPPRMESQQEKYYRQENEHRSLRDLGSGLGLLGTGFMALLMGIIFSWPRPSLDSTTTTIPIYWLCLTLPIAVFGIVAGLSRILRR